MKLKVPDGRRTVRVGGKPRGRKTRTEKSVSVSVLEFEENYVISCYIFTLPTTFDRARRRRRRPRRSGDCSGSPLLWWSACARVCVLAGSNGSVHLTEDPRVTHCLVAAAAAANEAPARPDLTAPEQPTVNACQPEPTEGFTQRVTDIVRQRGSCRERKV